MIDRCYARPSILLLAVVFAAGLLLVAAPQARAAMWTGWQCSNNCTYARAGAIYETGSSTVLTHSVQYSGKRKVSTVDSWRYISARVIDQWYGSTIWSHSTASGHYYNLLDWSGQSLAVGRSTRYPHASVYFRHYTPHGTFDSVAHFSYG